jgi:hypothetical protein
MPHTQNQYYLRSVSTGNCHAANVLAPHSFSSQFTIAKQAKRPQATQHERQFSYLTMFMRYLTLAILASTAFSQSAPESANSNDMARQLADFDWGIQPEDGYPIINFNDTNAESEVVFKYNFTGTLTATKFLDVKLYEIDCLTPADASALAFVNSTTGDELQIELDVIQETVSQSNHYQDINASAAIIGFCLRVDYNYVNTVGGAIESVSFYETNVTITVDLTADFTLAAIDVERTSADSEAANFKLDYPVEAYICRDDNSVVDNPAALTQGSFLQVCVRIDDDVVTENIIVEDILTFVVSQPLGPGTDSETITEGTANPLTDKVCRENGICNVKTQLLSKYFFEDSPNDLQVDGVAILAFGKASLMPSSAPSLPTGRRLRAPIRGLLSGDDVKAFMAAQQKNNNDDNNRDESGLSMVSVVADSSQRMLQDVDAQSKFGLDVGLMGINGDSSGEDSSSDGASTMVVAAIVLILLAAGGGFAFVYCTKRSQKEEAKDFAGHHSSKASVGTYPNQASVGTSSSSQNVSHRARGQQVD